MGLQLHPNCVFVLVQFAFKTRIIHNIYISTGIHNGQSKLSELPETCICKSFKHKNKVTPSNTPVTNDDSCYTLKM